MKSSAKSQLRQDPTVKAAAAAVFEGGYFALSKHLLEYPSWEGFEYARDLLTDLLEASDEDHAVTCAERVLAVDRALRVIAHPPAGERLYTSSEGAETFTWDEFVKEANTEFLPREDLKAVWRLKVGESWSIGGGAAAEITITRAR